MQTIWDNKVSCDNPPAADRSPCMLVRTAWSVRCGVAVAIPRTVLWDAWWLDREPLSYASNAPRCLS